VGWLLFLQEQIKVIIITKFQNLRDDSVTCQPECQCDSDTEIPVIDTKIQTTESLPTAGLLATQVTKKDPTPKSEDQPPRFLTLRLS
jgi:hypothetical protein